MITWNKYHECVDKVIEQVRWLYRIGELREITYDDCGAIAEEILTEAEYDSCTDFANGRFITEIYQKI